MAEGQPQAWQYTPGRIDDEVRIAVKRRSRQDASTASLLNLAVSAVLNKEAVRDFNAKLKELNT